MYKRDPSLKKHQKRALLVELRPVHGWLIPPQCIFLTEAGYHVDVVITDKQWEIELLKRLGEHVNLRVFDACSLWPKLLTIWRDLWLEKYDFVVFNSITRDIILLALCQPARFRAIIHRAEWEYLAPKCGYSHSRLSPLSYTLRRLFLQRAERLYVLSEKLHDVLQQRVWEPKLRYFSPSYFPNLQIAAQYQEGERVAFAVLGEVDNTRRNYQSLIDCLGTIAQSPLKHQIEIRLMGRATKPEALELQDIARSLRLLHSVVKLQNDGFVPFPEYANTLASSHFILLLIDRNIKAGYNQSVVPSSLMLSRAFALPIVYSADFSLDEDLHPYGILYEDSALLSGIAKAVELCKSGQYVGLRRAYAEYTSHQYVIHRNNYLS